MVHDGGPAFPGMASTMTQDSRRGMSLRYYTAVEAMKGFLTGMAYQKLLTREFLEENWVNVARASFALADKMLKQETLFGSPNAEPIPKGQE